MNDLLMEAMLGGGLGSLSELSQITELFNTVITSMMWLIVLISIPALVLAVANCFFGVRIFRVLLVINTTLGAGLFGMLLFGTIAISKGNNPVAPMIISFILFGAIFGVLSWFFYKVFLFIQSFNIGFGFVWSIGLPIIFGSIITNALGIALGSASATSGMQLETQIMGLFATITGKLVFLLVFSLIVAIALGILSVIYTKWIVMGTTAYKGGAKIASILALLAITKPAYLVVYFLLLIAFVVGGFCTQYFMDKKNPCNIDNANIARQPQQYYQPQPYQQSQYQPQYAQPQQYTQPVNVMHPVLKGIEGQYKGFDFDIDKDTTFGRDVEKCNIIFPDTCAGVSKIQCQLLLNQQTGAVAVVDKFSSYGTSVNGVKLSHDETRYLNPGDVIMFGENNVFKIEFTS